MMAIHWKRRTIGCAGPARLFWQTSQRRRTDALGEPRGRSPCARALRLCEYRHHQQRLWVRGERSRRQPRPFRVPVDPPTIDHRERLWDRRSEIAAVPSAIFSKNRKRSDRKQLGTAWRQGRAVTLAKGAHLYQIYGNAARLVGYATQADGSLAEITSVKIPYNSPQGLAGF